MSLVFEYDTLYNLCQFQRYSITIDNKRRHLLHNVFNLKAYLLHKSHLLDAHIRWQSTLLIEIGWNFHLISLAEVRLTVIDCSYYQIIALVCSQFLVQYIYSYGQRHTVIVVPFHDIKVEFYYFLGIPLRLDVHGCWIYVHFFSVICSLLPALIVLGIFESPDQFYLSFSLSNYKCICICNVEGGLGLTNWCMDMGWVYALCYLRITSWFKYSHWQMTVELWTVP